ncbi:RICIN domain-containing protein [Kribbella sp. NPDC003505]|uniref:RICIN domain-containing protein n=1 Tax=Kribbella sp. NPDC003505 TaxID=3154448 RepID=UPI0033AF8303
MSESGIARKLKVAAAAAAVMVSAVLSAGHAQASVPPESSYGQIMNAETRGLLAASGTFNGASLVQWYTAGQTDGYWKFVKKVDADGEANDRYWIVNKWSGRCASISGGALYNGAGATQWDCNPDAWATYWFVRLDRFENGTPLYQLVNVWSGKCLAIPAGSTSNGTQAIQWGCADDPDQLWTLGG